MPLVSLIAAVVVGSIPITPAGLCPAIAARIDRAQIETSIHEVDEIGDDSAPRQAARKTADASLMAEAAANIAQLAAHHCPAYPHVIDQRAYFGAALHCSTLNLNDKGTQTPATVEACRQSTWKRDGF